MDPAIEAAIIAAVATIGAALVMLIGQARAMRAENTDQHAQGRRLIEAHGEKLDHISGDVKKVRKDVKKVARRVDVLEDQS